MLYCFKKLRDGFGFIQSIDMDDILFSLYERFIGKTCFVCHIYD